MAAASGAPFVHHRLKSPGTQAQKNKTPAFQHPLKGDQQSIVRIYKQVLKYCLYHHIAIFTHLCCSYLQGVSETSNVSLTST